MYVLSNVKSPFSFPIVLKDRGAPPWGSVTPFDNTVVWDYTPRYTPDYYVSTVGSDGANGLTPATAWATFAHAYTVMSPGDVLQIQNGTYSEELHPPLALRGDAVNGYTTFQAETAFSVTLDMSANAGTDVEAISIFSQHTSGGDPVDWIQGYYRFDGFICRPKGEADGISVTGQDEPLESQMSHHIEITRCGAFGSGYRYDLQPISISRCFSSLIEDCFAYGFGRKAIQIYGCRSFTGRRLVMRWDWYSGDLDGQPNDPRLSFTNYNSQNCVFENLVALDAGASGYHQAGGLPLHVDNGNPVIASRDDINMTGNVGSSLRSEYWGSDNVQMLGSISLGSQSSGFYLNGGTTTAVNSNITVSHCLSVDAANHAFNFKGYDSGGSELTNNSGINPLNRGMNALGGTGSVGEPILDVNFDYNITSGGSQWSFHLAEYPAKTGTLVQSFVDNATDNSNLTFGYEIEGVQTLAELNTTYFPEVILPVRPIQTAAADTAGVSLGAEVLYRYQDAALTTERLWPWRYEEVIKTHMLNDTDLVTVGRTGANVPGWKTHGGSLTEYIWESNGGTMPNLETVYP